MKIRHCKLVTHEPNKYIECQHQYSERPSSNSVVQYKRFCYQDFIVNSILIDQTQLVGLIIKLILSELIYYLN